jgi:hypothetical protein
MGHILLGVNSILTFLAGVYNSNEALLIAAGITSTVSIVLLKFAVYSLKESDERHHSLCEQLKYFHVQAPPPLSPSNSSIRGANLHGNVEEQAVPNSSAVTGGDTKG